MMVAGMWFLVVGCILARGQIDIVLALKSQEEKGTGRAKSFAEWCEGQVGGFR